MTYMETEATTAAKVTYMFTRTALDLATELRNGDISPTEEHRLLDAVEQIATLTDRPGRVVWLELVEGVADPEATYAVELAGNEALHKAAQRRKEALLRQKALAMLGME